MPHAAQQPERSGKPDRRNFEFPAVLFDMFAPSSPVIILVPVVALIIRMTVRLYASHLCCCRVFFHALVPQTITCVAFLLTERAPIQVVPLRPDPAAKIGGSMCSRDMNKSQPNNSSRARRNKHKITYCRRPAQDQWMGATSDSPPTAGPTETHPVTVVRSPPWCAGRGSIA